MSRVAEGPGRVAAVDKRVVLFVVALSSYLSSVMGSAVNVAIPTIGREFAADAVTLSWIATGFLLTTAVFMVPSGRLADIYGRKRMFLYGVLGWTLTSLLCGLATSAPMLIAFRGLQGITGAMFFGTATAIISLVYPPQERGRALGFYTMAVYTGLAMGPTLGGLITQHIGWRSMFFLNSVLGVALVAIILTLIKTEWIDARGEKLDFIGSVVFGLALVFLIYGLTILPSSLGIVLVLLGLLFLAAFVVWESRVPNPVLNIDLFRLNTVFAFSNLAAFAIYSATAGVGFLLSLYLQFVKGLDPQTAGLVLLSQPIMMATISPLAGRLSDRIEPRLVASAGMALNTATMILLALLDDSSGLWYVIGALLVGGIGFGLFSSPNTNAIMGSVERRDLGVASATLGVMRSVGQMLSLAIATLIIAVLVGGVQITPEHHASFSAAFRLAFLIFAGLCVVGFFSSLARGKVHSS